MEQTETYDIESITVGGAAVGFDSDKVAVDNDKFPARAVCTLEDAPIRYRLEGTPTSSVGHLMEVGDALVVDSLKDLQGFRAIRTGSVSGVLKVSYEQEAL